jgi:hypothetical protein
MKLQKERRGIDIQIAPPILVRIEVAPHGISFGLKYIMRMVA